MVASTVSKSDAPSSVQPGTAPNSERLPPNHDRGPDNLGNHIPHSMTAPAVNNPGVRPPP